MCPAPRDGGSFPKQTGSTTDPRGVSQQQEENPFFELPVSRAGLPQGAVTVAGRGKKWKISVLSRPGVGAKERG